MKNIENYIKQNKEKFNENLPDEHFDKFKNKLDKQKNNRIKRILQVSYKYAAAVILLVSLFFVYRHASNTEKVISANISKENTQNEFNEAFAYYTNIIKSKKTELKKLHCKNVNINSTEILNDLKELENSFKELVKEYKNNPKNEQIYNAIIENYNMRIEFLDMVTEKLKNYC